MIIIIIIIITYSSGSCFCNDRNELDLKKIK